MLARIPLALWLGSRSIIVRRRRDTVREDPFQPPIRPAGAMHGPVAARVQKFLLPPPLSCSPLHRNGTGTSASRPAQRPPHEPNVSGCARLQRPKVSRTCSSSTVGGAATSRRRPGGRKGGTGTCFSLSLVDVRVYLVTSAFLSGCSPGAELLLLQGRCLLWSVVRTVFGNMEWSVMQISVELNSCGLGQAYLVVCTV
ncbi:hypothetical protein PAHAL_7G237400 [Panicum hallii]|jgi:hypothetical protein|uniref:Uncharacterized protein n=1 Tax=Panicum hallii TaxID=206008 RepID=A0A2T8IDB3_9POAL|nr:hypothetical protein PAHAL_7G237400 [Panicum hallii]